MHLRTRGLGRVWRVRDLIGMRAIGSPQHCIGRRTVDVGEPRPRGADASLDRPLGASFRGASGAPDAPSCFINGAEVETDIAVRVARIGAASQGSGPFQTAFQTFHRRILADDLSRAVLAGPYRRPRAFNRRIVFAEGRGCQGPRDKRGCPPRAGASPPRGRSPAT